MNLSKDEARALGFVALLLAVSAAVRLLDRPAAVSLDAAGVDIGALEAASRAAERPDRPESLKPGEKLDPNTAKLEQLLRLPRMRRATANAIVSARSAKPFMSVADLDRLPGVGPATLEAWRPHLTLPDGPPSQPAAAAPTPTASPAAAATTTGPVAVNTATAEELQRLPGIGPALAARIIAWRDSAGAFRTPEDLMKVRGIGAATLKRLRPLITLR